MKLLFLLFFSLIASVISASAQSNEKPSLPKAEDIERVEISPTNAVNWYKPEELIKLLPQCVAAEGTYGTKAVPFQRGKFILKNGKEIAWMENHDDSILLLDGSQERLFVLPKKDEAIFRVWDKDGNEGYIYRNGKPANLIVRNAVGDFSEGLAPALVGDKWGYIDRRGDLVIAPRWKNNDGSLPPVSPFH